MIAFCEGIQAAAPVDSYVAPVPGEMPDMTVMSSWQRVILFRDLPLNFLPMARYVRLIPFIFKGGLTWPHAKLGILSSVQRLYEKGLAKLPNNDTDAVR